MDPVSLVMNIVSIAQAIHAQVQLAEANQAQLQRLNERITQIVSAIQGLSTLPKTQNFCQSLKALLTCLGEIQTFAIQFARVGAIRRFVFANSYQAQFEGYNQRLRDLLPQLNVGLSAQALVNQAQDHGDAEADRRALEALNGQILT